MSEKISNALQNLFGKHRIVFWYDPQGELREEFDQAYLLGVEKLEIKNNEFGLKYHILREKPRQRFLLYHEGPQPADLDNWLLDVQLAHGVFSADQISLWMTELGLGPEYRELFEGHQDFFRAQSRREAFKERLIKGQSYRQLRLIMMGVCLGMRYESRLESILMGLLDELAAGADDAYLAMEKFSLLPFLWGDLQTVYGYQSDQPHIKDFAINLFDACYKIGLNEPAELTQEAVIFLNHWQDSLKSRDSFERLSDQFSADLNIRDDIKKRSIADLVSLDSFKIIDFRILELLMTGVIDQSITEKQCREIVHRRASTYWYQGFFEMMYKAVNTASQMLTKLRDFQFQIESISDGINKYASSWYQVDQLYRDYVYAVRQSKQTTFFSHLNQIIDGHYNNTFLTPLNNNWQLVVDQAARWGHLSVQMQRNFYRDQVEPILAQSAKVAVVISDAMRYEVGKALCTLIEREGRFTAEVSPMLGMLPSYTQLGMAALLPNDEMIIRADGTVVVDGMSAAGTENRGKLLAHRLPGESKALLSEDIAGMTTEERRGLFRENQVVYVYHNQIDAVGDKLSEEGRTVDAVETTLTEVVDVVKMLANANFTTILVTADHGFLYQHGQIDESDFAVTEIRGEEIFSKNRRYVLGRGLEKHPSLKHYTAEQAELTGDYEMLIAKSINRFRLSGASIRYVHGGASLQEVVIPVVSISKERTRASEVRPVEVDKINGGSNKITTGQVSVKFYQVEPTSTKVSGRTLRAGVYAQDGRLLTEVHTLQFSYTSPNPRDREINVSFKLTSEADDYNHQVVFLRLEELISNTNKYTVVKEWAYHLDKTLFTLF